MRIQRNFPTFHNNGFLVTLLFVVVIGLILVFFAFVSDFPSNKSADWASFATFVGLGMSLISVLFIYLTYRSQITLSSVLQFDSTFFQWFAIHYELKNSLKDKISSFVKTCILPDMEKLSKFTDSSFAEIMDNHQDEARELLIYYKSTYQLLLHIYRSPILTKPKERKKYYDMMQSYMDDDELILFLSFLMADVNRNKCNLQSPDGEETSFLKLVDKFHLLKNLYYSKSNSPMFWNFMLLQFRETANSFYHPKLV